MPTGRTATTAWKKARATALGMAIYRGQTQCPLCTTHLTYTHAGLPNSAEVDHIIPHALGGTDDPDNLRVICRQCNQSTGGRLGNQRMRDKKTPAGREPITPVTTFPW